jgi:excisionase family DNA binding protein
MLKVREVAKRLNLSISKTYELIERGELGHHRLGRSIRVSESQVTAYLEITKREPASRRSETNSRPRLKHLSL